tara:strand:+ start:4459 stop:5700 length:1242 start_codon:yes stop_codon:yes gene_type:complete
MKKLLFLLIALLTINTAEAQFFKEIYKDFLKYGTVYAAGDISNAYENSRKDYFVERPADGDLYGIPRVIDATEYYDFDYRIGFGIRKLARFDYEVKPGNFWTGNNQIEKQTALSAPTSAVKGFEYLIHWEKQRLRDEVFTNHRYFLRHTGKYHIAKIESRENGNVGFKYSSAEVRGRLPIGKKFSISAGVIARTHETAYGYNPIEIWLNETSIATDNNGNPIIDPNTGNPYEYPTNPWYSLGYEYGYSDHLTTYTDEATGEEKQDWIWKDEDGAIVAYSDIDFRNGVFGDLMNRYNNEIWDELDPYALLSPIIGADFYHYKNNFWVHAYANWLPGYHKYIKGDGDFTYLNRDNWGKGGLREDAEPNQWEDYQFGLNMGWKVGKNLGVFIDGEYTKFWDTRIFQSTFGINYTFR